ncbi:MerR family transcriptional regulator [Sporosarcina thermotolerans]|uniref:MerR family transcriptional regulator n=1 Tax=Sporosarcina thermotolerans TaxID=633404 RepID=A0AAW9A796_9BACL|nr:MerR family transcriptional regulator [Sporosarcina thermotolerans]MDW0116825.1 MerR family transcriptional regulator [Sporosarcina thermotolerans]WHT48998.1 MerR family transcriptional regulator [Sporosarcina thermotolerans]
MKVKEVADLTGVSVRTLHHYDDIGLLVPEEVTEAGYRVYSDQNLTTLQQILFFREVGFPLKKIKELLGSPSFNRLEAFELQREMLLAKQQQLEVMIATIDKTLLAEKGEMIMTNEEKFKGFDFSSNSYEQEARDRWGDEAVDKANKNVSQFGEKEQQEMNRIYFQLAALRHTDPASVEAQTAIDEWYTFLNKIGDYSLEAFAGLGEMYVVDERFMKNIDQFGEGLSVFMRDAMKVYAEKN